MAVGGRRLDCKYSFALVVLHDATHGDGGAPAITAEVAIKGFVRPFLRVGALVGAMNQHELTDWSVSGLVDDGRHTLRAGVYDKLESK